MSPVGGITEFRGNVIRHGSEYVELATTDVHITVSTAPFEMDDTNNVERNLT